jgi:hypothetical protein
VRLVAPLLSLGLVLSGSVSVVRADTSIGVVVSGPEEIARKTKDTVEAWITANGLPVTPSPMSKDGLKTLINCFVLSDMTCARGVVEARAKAANVVGFTEQVTGKAEKRTVQLAAYWIAKEHEAVSLQRTCDKCTDEVLARTLDAMLDDLAKLAPTMVGTIHVTTLPTGLRATVDGDNDADETTPFDKEVAFGSHVVAIMRGGRTVATQRVDVKPGATIDVPIEVPDEPKVKEKIKFVRSGGTSRAVPVVILTVGLAAALTGGVLYWYGGPTGASYTYRNMRPAGIATGVSGGVAIIVGAVWLAKGGSKSSHPEVSVTSTETTIGWARSF